jgi:hypothetical protein
MSQPPTGQSRLHRRTCRLAHDAPFAAALRRWLPLYPARRHLRCRPAPYEAALMLCAMAGHGHHCRHPLPATIPLAMAATVRHAWDEPADVHIYKLLYVDKFRTNLVG